MTEHTIWKRVLPVVGEQTITIPEGAKFFSCQLQGVDIGVWYVFEKTEVPKLAVRHIRIIETGNPILDYDRLSYIGTVQLHGGQIIKHVFEITDG